MTVETQIESGKQLPVRKKPNMVRTAVIVGTALEHYDFFLYGTASALVFNAQYFTSENPLVATLAAFATFAVGFAARPLGAVIFGHLGDTMGRRKTLILTLVLMGIATGVMGLIPNYDSIGVLAPILLVTLRFLQGISFGGEWAGAVTLASEHAPKGREGIYASLPQLGSPIGNIVGSGAFLLVGLMPVESFDAWGWRVPFLLAFPLLLVALWVRTLVDESPAFKTATQSNSIQKVPVWDVIRNAPGRLVTAAAIAFIGIGGFFVVTTFAISYGTGTVGLTAATMLTATLTSALVQIGTVITTGAFADRVSPIRIATIGCVLTILLATPAFIGLSSGVPILAVISVVVINQPIAMVYAVTGAILPELFGTTVRYSGVAVGFNIAGFVGGFMPMLATWLLIAFNAQVGALIALLIVIAAISLVGVRLAKPMTTFSQK